MKNFEHVGQWWIPDSPERKILGTLKFDPATGGILELFGDLVDDGEDGQRSLPSTILGEYFGGKVTLLNNGLRESNLTTQGIGLTIYETRLICDGIHLQSKDDLKFSRLSVHYSYLNQWVGIESFNTHASHSSDKSFIEYEDAITVAQISITEDIKLAIEIRTRKEGKWVKDLRLSQLVYMTISFSRLHSLTEAEQVLRHLRNFLSFAIMYPVQPLDVTGVMIGDRLDNMNGAYKQGSIFVNLFRPLLNASENHPGFTPRESVGFHFDILFGFRRNFDKFEILIKNWFEKADWLETVYELYFSIFYKKLYLQNEFLILTQALEIFHRKNPKFDQYELLEEDYNKRKLRILEAVPLEDREWLEGKLEHSNEKRLRKRLKDILGCLQSVIQRLSINRKGFALILSKRSQDSLSQQIAFNRNCLTHYDESCKEKAADNLKLYYLIEKLKIIICLSLMQELGFEEEEIAQFLSEGNIGFSMDLALTESHNIQVLS